jgi:hypothetical protein
MDWPVLYLDSCSSSEVEWNLKDLLSTPISSLIKSGSTEESKLLQRAHNEAKARYHDSIHSLIDHFVNLIRGKINLFEKLGSLSDFAQTGQMLPWVLTRLQSLSSPPSSLLQFLESRLITALANCLSRIWSVALSNLSQIKPDSFSILNFLLNHRIFVDQFTAAMQYPGIVFREIDSRYSCDDLPYALQVYELAWFDRFPLQARFPSFLQGPITNHFIASLIFRFDPGLSVSDTAVFAAWVLCVREILRSLFNGLGDLSYEQILDNAG